MRRREASFFFREGASSTLLESTPKWEKMSLCCRRKASFFSVCAARSVRIVSIWAEMFALLSADDDECAGTYDEEELAASKTSSSSSILGASVNAKCDPRGTAVPLIMPPRKSASETAAAP